MAKKNMFQRVPTPEVEQMEANQPIRFYYSDKVSTPPNALRVQLGSIDVLAKDVLEKEELAELKSFLAEVEAALFESAGFSKKEVDDDEDDA